MQQKKLSFLLSSIVLVMAFLLTACQPPATVAPEATVAVQATAPEATVAVQATEAPPEAPKAELPMVDIRW